MKFAKYLLLFVLICIPALSFGQAKPKRDVSKDKKTIVAKKTTATPTVNKTSAPSAPKVIAKKTTTKKTTTKKSYFSISSDYARFDCNGGKEVFTVSSSSAWKISTDTYSWGQLVRNGNTLILTVDANNNSFSRDDYFILQSGNNTIKVDIFQDAAQKFEVSNKSLHFSGEGGDNSFTVDSNYAWDIAPEHASWCHVTRVNGSVKVSIDKNTSSDARRDYIKLKSGQKTIIVDVIQDKAVLKKFEVSDTYLRFSEYANHKTVKVECTGKWSIKGQNENWVHSYKDGDNLNITVNANYSTVSRVDIINLECEGIVRKIYISQEPQKEDVHKSTTYTPRYRTNWWKGRVSFGWNIIGVEGEEHNLTFRSGLRLRFGKHSDFLNIILGADYTYHAITNKFTLDFSDMSFDPLAQMICPNVNIRFNIIRLGDNCKLYIGCEGEYGFRIYSEGRYKEYVRENAISVSPQLGFNFKHFDINFNYKRYINGYHITQFDDFDKGRYGGNLIVYF